MRARARVFHRRGHVQHPSRAVPPIHTHAAPYTRPVHIEPKREREAGWSTHTRTSRERKLGMLSLLLLRCCASLTNVCWLVATASSSSSATAGTVLLVSAAVSVASPSVLFGGPCDCVIAFLHLLPRSLRQRSITSHLSLSHFSLTAFSRVVWVDGGASGDTDHGCGFRCE